MRVASRLVCVLGRTPSLDCCRIVVRVGCLRAGVGTLARRPQGGGPARSVDLYPNAILFTAVPPYAGTNGAAVHSHMRQRATWTWRMLLKDRACCSYAHAQLQLPSRHRRCRGHLRGPWSWATRQVTGRIVVTVSPSRKTTGAVEQFKEQPLGPRRGFLRDHGDQCRGRRHGVLNRRTRELPTSLVTAGARAGIPVHQPTLIGVKSESHNSEFSMLGLLRCWVCVGRGDGPSPTMRS